jgi:hypothetical protein
MLKKDYIKEINEHIGYVNIAQPILIAEVAF